MLSGVPTSYEFSFVIRNKANKDSYVADPLNRRKHLSTSMSLTILEFKEIRREYNEDKDFGQI